ncbi:MAG: molybdopterin molybdotransferase MoeA [Verrucomicrobiota bacterium]|nr:molybdopterin molybdotransferase MoeA [Verrucomicrobiota bacterium]
MISLAEARAIIARSVLPGRPAPMPLAYTSGRVLREETRADQDYPPFDRSAMDGYAVRSRKKGNAAERFRVIGEVRPGNTLDRALAEGECVRIFTGGVVPAEASQVVTQEDVRREGEWIVLTRRSTATHIRRQGEDAKAGQLLLPAGSRLRPSDTALLAQIGRTRPFVSRLPRVVHLVTGSELVAPEQTPKPGEIRDSNSALVSTLLRDAGALCVWQERARDELDVMTCKVGSLRPDTWDLLCISGGASVGDYDFGKQMLRELGFTLHFEGVDLRPGKPLVFGTRRKKAAFVLPGNPVSHFVTFHVAVRVALDRLVGLEPAWPLVEIEVAGAPPASSDARETYWPAHLHILEGRLRVRPLQWQSSGDLCGLVSANALIQLLPGTGPLNADAPVHCLLLDHSV